VAVWNSSNAEQMLRVATSEHAVFRILPGDRLATAGRDGVVRVWNLAGHEDLTLYGHVGRVTGLGVLPDGRTLVSGGATGEVKFWDLRTGVELFSLRRHSTAVTVIEFAGNARVLVTGGDGQFAVWDARE
jgi:WD40 repeat protein